MDFLIGMFGSRIDELIFNFNWMSVLELLIIVCMILPIYWRFIKHSSSRKLFNGVASIFFMYIFSRFLVSINLFILGRFLEGVSLILLFSLVVIFQPELRRFLGYLGQPGFIQKTFLSPQKSEVHQTDFVKELSEAIKYLSKSKIGALLVVQDSEDMAAYSGIGTKIFSAISSELILTIFHPNTALHDGAMILTTQKIIAAGVLLPLTENPELSWQYGTRHRAAIGITEISDATCIVVSEETGFVSFVKNGSLKKIESLEALNFELNKLVAPQDSNRNKKKKLKQNEENSIDS